MHYTPHADHAFTSVERIMRDVNWGWLLRYLHMNGASFFFIAVYIHIFRGMYYGSYKKPRELLWILGVLIFLLMMATAFIGYTLPWSQMGGWAATVITNLFSAIPVFGESIVQFLWGGFSVDNPTLNRFFSLHYLLPFVIFAVVFLHVWALHVTGSNNPTGIDPKGKQDTLPFHPFYTTKDLFGLGVFLLLYVIVSFYAPNMFSHPDHYVEFDPLLTPHHIVPEWYFLPFYAILRAIVFDFNLMMMGGIGVMFLPFFVNLGVCIYNCIFGFLKMKLPHWDTDNFNPAYVLAGIVIFAAGLMLSGMIPLLTDVVFIEAKLGGVIAMFGAVILLFFMPWLDSHPVRSARYRPMYKLFLLLMVVSFLALGWVGAQLPEGLPVLVGQIGTAYYFGFFVIILPWLSRNEKAMDMPNSINDAVLEEQKRKMEMVAGAA
jgi:quinol-cytochrome oxidoreductase complex cytochrome b subunit